MKSFILVLLLTLLCALTSCEVTDPVVDSPQDTYIPNLYFTVDTTYLDSGADRLVASGIGVPLSSGQSTFWTIYYSSSSVDVRSYPSFGVNDLRGIYK
jgi:hypothetical protein